MLDLQDIQVFVRVAEEKSFTRAGEKLGLSKSRVSLRLRALEETLGVSLLQRSTRAVQLTSAGDEFHVRAQQLLADADALDLRWREAPVPVATPAEVPLDFCGRRRASLRRSARTVHRDPASADIRHMRLQFLVGSGLVLVGIVAASFVWPGALWALVVAVPLVALDSTGIERMQARMDALGVRFRPHVKTSKSLPVVQAQLAAGARGITVSTLKEAEAFFAAGFDDILYAVGLVPDKIARALALQQRGCRLQVIVDSIEAARAVAQAAPALPVLIEVDVDGHRSGVDPLSDELITIGRALHDGGGTLHGVMTHAGSSYDLDTPAALQALAEQERALCVRAAERLRAAGLPCPVVSIGSTPTALSAQRLDGVTEVRAGVYVFFDLVIHNVGVCTMQDIALSVLTTVIGHQKARGWTLVDAGWMAMSRDRGTAAQAIDQGYGMVCDLEGRVLPDLIISQANQEHGIISLRKGSSESMPDLPVGSRLRILPNHACATAAQHDRYHVVSSDGGPLREWTRFGGW